MKKKINPKELPRSDNKEGLYPYVVGEKQLPSKYIPGWIKELQKLLNKEK